MTDDLAAWVRDYTDALPDRIRPPASDTRLQIAADTASRNGWAPRQLATVVRTANIGNARNPQLIALMRMEDHASRPPATLTQRKPKGNASGCTVCAPDQTCNDPVLGTTPPAWVAERMGLLRELMRTPDLSEDEREDCMRVLIAVQRNNHTKAQ